MAGYIIVKVAGYIIVKAAGCLEIRPHKQTSLFHIPAYIQYLELIWSRVCGKCAELGFWKFIDGSLVYES